MGNWNTLEGKNILEIRTGGGGGLNYLAQALNPDKAIGVDISSFQTDFCKKSFCENPKMKFYTTVKFFEIIIYSNLSRIHLIRFLALENWLIKELMLLFPYRVPNMFTISK